MPDESQCLEPRRIAVTGGRDFDDAQAVARAFDAIALSSADTLVHGDCRGCDRLCERIARNRYHASSEAHPADWRTHGKAAGPIRNREMLESGIDMLIAFPGGKGTCDCVRQALMLGVKVCFPKPEDEIDDVAKAVGA